MLGVELDDSSHETSDSKYRDMFKNRLFAHVGIPLVRIHVTEMTRLELMVEKLTGAWERRSRALAAPNVRWSRCQPTLKADRRFASSPRVREELCSSAR
jgi:hypothetical protein